MHLRKFSLMMRKDGRACRLREKTKTLQYIRNLYLVHDDLFSVNQRGHDDAFSNQVFSRIGVRKKSHPRQRSKNRKMMIR